ncbi:magnesium chelatase [Kurthia zopfii]|uniref:MoxR-like ATPase n=1 Tax=Kurthia zopfii TaxID=1650 RepID=A0A8B4QB49_9BACL|nr:MoxR family ATPase [Kurthia zopfii]PWI21701.1 AAA family ATPase [Kurthia zopfii]TDR35735.1 MoxR-like ATPase [Kurthia zopfii]GEK31224.1 magnesium chelatase [Kurthia zopfii]STX09936.1 recombination factor protein RarA [Kurthia zopfii]
MTTVNNIISEVETVIKGKRKVIEKVFTAILAEGHILLEDVPGIGKTTLALAFSKVLGLNFSRIQFTPDVTASDVVGFTYYDKEQDRFQYRQGAVMSNFVLGDEINRTSSRTQSALLEVMEEGAVTVDGVRYEVPKPFTVMATQNPIDHIGTQKLPQAQLDRFMMKLTIGYPDYQSQMELLRDRQTAQPLDHIRPIVNASQLIEMQQVVKNTIISEEILDYVTKLSMETRTIQEVAQGISPRGALSICRAAKAHAYIQNRNYVIPEDVMAVFLDTTHHRIVLSPTALTSAETILRDVLKNTPSPDVLVQ